MGLSISERRTGVAPSPTVDGQYRLAAEVEWVVEGDDALLHAVARALPRFCERVGPALILWFGNAVGVVDGGPLGRLVVHSGKWEEADFEGMLAEITKRMALLPFAAGTGAEQDHERSPDVEQRVLYHAFVYLRHLLSPSAATDDRLVPALRLVLARPHRRFERVSTWTPLAAVQRVEPRALLGMVTPRARLVRAPEGRGGRLATALGGHLPQEVEETRNRSTVDVPENQFVKAFLGYALEIIERMRVAASGLGDTPLRARVVSDCETMARELLPLRRHALWDEVSEMRRLPVESQVLQRRRGYREVLRCFLRLRLTARLPLRPEATMRLLEIKDIAALYEMWSFFEVERQVSRGLGRLPIEAGVAKVGDFGAKLDRGLRIAWEGGIELFYNLSYSRSRSNRSYSLPLRPDIVLRVPDGPSQGDHLFDAKFKVRRLEDAVPSGEDVDDAEPAADRRGVFKHADLHKMHTYRDAIPSARSVWILYPGTDFCFFDEAHGRIAAPDDVKAPANGVGAIPLLPGETGDVLARLVARMING